MKSSTEETLKISLDQGNSTTSKLSASQSVRVFMPDGLTRAPELQNAATSLLPGDQSSSSSSGNTESMRIGPNVRSYNMKHKYRGKCIVFNHEHFDTGHKFREGSSIDATRIERTFENLGFTVEVLDNLEYIEILGKLSELSKEDHTDADCLCIFILTHGKLNNMICARDADYLSDRIWRPFSADKCKSLAGKPKLFFFQACRGGELDDGITLINRTMMERMKMSDTTTMQNMENDGTALNVSSYKVPIQSDFLIAYSSVEDHSAWRDKTKGTWFIQTLCDVLGECADRTDVMKMMTITARRIATTEASRTLDPAKNDKKQVPSIMSTLLKDLYFYPQE